MRRLNITLIITIQGKILSFCPTSLCLDFRKVYKVHWRKKAPLIHLHMQRRYPWCNLQNKLTILRVVLCPNGMTLQW